MIGTFSPPPRVSDPDMYHGTCVTHAPWFVPGSLTSGFLWSRWRGKRSRHSRRMRNPQFCASGKRPMYGRISSVHYQFIYDSNLYINKFSFVFCHLSHYFVVQDSNQLIVAAYYTINRSFVMASSLSTIAAISLHPVWLSVRNKLLIWWAKLWNSLVPRYIYCWR